MRLKDLIACLFNGHGIPRKVFFRVDAGRIKGLSFGHLARCHVLSKALRKYWNTETIFIMQNYTDGVKHADVLGETVALVNDSRLNLLENLSDAIIFDLPNGPGTDELAIAKEKGLWTIILDDTNNNVPWANVVLNSSILAQSTNYPREAQLLLGSEYFILDEQFETADRKTRRQNGLFNILVTFGGSDPTGLTLKVLKTLAKSVYPEFVFKIVLGPGYTDFEELENVVDCFSGKLNLFRNPDDLLPFFNDCDLAICAGGRTLYELVALKVPTLAIASIDHEESVIDAFLKKGLILGGLNEWDESDFLRLFKSVLKRFKGNIFDLNCNQVYGEENGE